MPKILLLAALLVGSGAGQSSLDFVQVTDTHVTLLERAEAKVARARAHFAPSSAALPAFFAGPGKKLRPSFFLVTGDLIDAFRYEGQDGQPLYGQVEAFTRAVSGVDVPLYLALGNHDIVHYSVDASAGRLRADQSVAGEARAAWIGAAACFSKGTYYSFEKRAGERAYRFIVLDNAYNSGAIAAEQLQWLRREVENQGSRVLILAMHIPLGADANSSAIKDSLARARVSLVLAGHNHTNGVEEIAAGAGTAVQVRTAAFGYGVNNWRRIRLREDAIDVFETGSFDTVLRTVPAARAAATGR